MTDYYFNYCYQISQTPRLCFTELTLSKHLSKQFLAFIIHRVEEVKFETSTPAFLKGQHGLHNKHTLCIRQHAFYLGFLSNTQAVPAFIHTLEPNMAAVPAPAPACSFRPVPDETSMIYLAVRSFFFAKTSSSTLAYLCSWLQF